jgi:hypothetical protein
MGRLFVKALGKPSEILAKLNEMAGFSPDQEIELYEARLNFCFDIFIVLMICPLVHCCPNALILSVMTL